MLTLCCLVSFPQHEHRGAMPLMVWHLLCEQSNAGDALSGTAHKCSPATLVTEISGVAGTRHVQPCAAGEPVGNAHPGCVRQTAFQAEQSMQGAIFGKDPSEQQDRAAHTKATVKQILINPYILVRDHTST